MSAIEWMKLELTKQFEMKDVGKAQTCLGLEIPCSCRNRKLWLSQTKYVSTILTKD